MIYLAKLLVVMTDGLKTVRIHAGNVHRVQEYKRLDDASLSLQKSDSVVFSMRWGTVLLKHNKTRPGTTCACLTVAVFTLIPNLSNLTLINPVLGKIVNIRV